MKPNPNRRFIICFFLVLFILPGCVSEQGPDPSSPAFPPLNQTAAVDWSLIPPPPASRDLVAVAGFENKSTYSADRLWDTSSKFLSTHLLRTGYFRVVEWEEMKRLFDWDTLSQVDIVKSPEKMKKARRILLCENFISGSITRFNISTYAQTSAMSKAKVIDTTVRVDLLLQSAQTGEYLATGQGEHTIRQVYSGGQIGSWNSSAGDDALDTAIGKALFELVSTYGRTGYSRGSDTPKKQNSSGVLLK
ncbi:MAG: CsgG/HfaB family protein [Pseudomonadota bacterium]